MGEGFEARDATFVERGVLGPAISGVAQATALLGLIELLLTWGPMSRFYFWILAILWLFLLGLCVNLSKGTIERTTVRANRQGLWVGGVFFPAASLVGARPFVRAECSYVRVTRRGFHFFPIDIGVRDVLEGERLMRALDLDGTLRYSPEIGADGILLWSAGRRRYIHYGAVERASLAPGADGIRLLLVGGEVVALPCRRGHTPAALREIDQAMAAFAAGGADAEVPHLDRGGRLVRAWIAELRTLGSGAHATHRVAPIAVDRLWRIVESPATQPTIRAAAAVALGPRLDPRDRDRLRAAASTTTAPRLRAALEAAAGSAGDTEVAALLAEVEGEDAPVERHEAMDRVGAG